MNEPKSALRAAALDAAPVSTTPDMPVPRGDLVADLRWWANNIALRDGPRSPWEHGLIRLLRLAADGLLDKAQIDASPSDRLADQQITARLEQIHQQLLHAQPCAVGDTVFLFDLIRELRPVGVRDAAVSACETPETRENAKESLCTLLPCYDEAVSVMDAAETLRATIKSEAGHIAYVDDEINALINACRAEARGAAVPVSPSAPEWQTLIKRLVIAWDAESLSEVSAAIATLRPLIGFTLSAHTCSACGSHVTRDGKTCTVCHGEMVAAAVARAAPQAEHAETNDTKNG